MIDRILNRAGERKPKPKVLDHGYGNVHKSKKQEGILAADIGGLRMPASGAIEGLKSDAVSEHWHGEAKMTGKSFIRIARKAVRKIWNEAAAHRKHPCIMISFDSAPFPEMRDFYVVPTQLLSVLPSKQVRRIDFKRAEARDKSIRITMQEAFSTAGSVKAVGCLDLDFEGMEKPIPCKWSMISRESFLRLRAAIER